MWWTLAREPDLTGPLARAGVPVLVACGEADDVWSPGTQRAMARSLSARMAVIGNARHTPNEERPLETAAQVLDFWAATENAT
jgi:pimeloyl-ACP methyl ester carboxylesterase